MASDARVSQTSAFGIDLGQFWSSYLGLTLVTLSLAVIVFVITPLREAGLPGRLFFDLAVVALMISGTVVIDQRGSATYADNVEINVADGGNLTVVSLADWDDDAGAESVCYSVEGRQFFATRSGIQISADDGPTQVILTVPGRTRVTGVALGGKDKDTLYALCGNKIWKRKVQHHAMGAWSPWTKVVPNKL